MEMLKIMAPPILIFVLLGVLMGALLALATKLFSVKRDERAEAIASCLPGANCGGCGYAGCSALADAIASGEARVTSCTVGGDTVASAIAEIMGVEAESAEKMRAVVKCVGSYDHAETKYIYSGPHDCAAAARLGGGDKICPTGCIGLGSCVEVCPFNAITVRDGVAAIDSAQCRGCGVCVSSCPRALIKLIPYSAHYDVMCSSCDSGKNVRSYCGAGCISCRICEKKCPAGAISVEANTVRIDHTVCTGCGTCADSCPRGIIRAI